MRALLAKLDCMDHYDWIPTFVVVGVPLVFALGRLA